jgi:hypothetical protein
MSFKWWALGSVMVSGGRGGRLEGCNAALHRNHAGSDGSWSRGGMRGIREKVTRVVD